MNHPDYGEKGRVANPQILGDARSAGYIGTLGK